jgi:cytochrome c biogenesis factor
MYVTPGQQFVWIGFLLAAIGGFIAMLTRLQRKGET